MTLENGSASANERTLACPSWLALPRVNRAEDRYTEKGHGTHGFVRAVLSGVPLEAALAAVTDPATRETCRLLDWAKLCGDLESIECEVAYALDVRARTARRLGVNIGRDYEAAAIAAGQPLGPYEIPGSLDIQGTRKSDGMRVVTDLKSGYQDVADVEENAQGLFFASVFHLLEGAPEVMVRIAKLKGSGDIWNDPATFRAWEVDEYLDELEDAIDRSKEARRLRLAGGTPDFNEGKWCGYCAAADACPAKNQLARSMLADLGTIEQRVAEMTAPQAGHAWELAHNRIEPVLERVLGALKERARREPLPLADGYELRESPYEKDSPDFAAACALARELGATEQQIKACHRSIVVRPIVARKTLQKAPRSPRARKSA